MKERLTPRQEKAIDLLLTYGSVNRVADELGCAHSTVWRWMQNLSFQQRYRTARRALTERAGAMLQQASQLAAARLIEMIRDEEVPPHIQFAAAVKVLEFGLQRIEIEDVQASVDELRQMLSEPVKKGLRAV